MWRNNANAIFVMPRLLEVETHSFSIETRGDLWKNDCCWSGLFLTRVDFKALGSSSGNWGRAGLYLLFLHHFHHMGASFNSGIFPQFYFLKNIELSRHGSQN